MDRGIGQHIRNAADRQILLSEQLFCLLDLQASEILHRAFANVLVKQAAELGLSDEKPCADIRQRDVSPHIFLQICDDQLDQRALSQGSGVFTAQNGASALVAAAQKHQQKFGQVTLQQLKGASRRGRKVKWKLVVVVVWDPSQRHARLLEKQRQKRFFGFAQREGFFIKKFHGGTA